MSDNTLMIGTKKELVRFSYAHLLEAKASTQGGDPKFSVSILIPKKYTKQVEALEIAIEDAFYRGIEEKNYFNGDTNAMNKSSFKYPLKDGDVERPEDPAYQGHYYINASTEQNRPPVVIDSDKVVITNPDKVQSGFYGRVMIALFPFDNVGRGVGCKLMTVQKADNVEYEPLSGGISNEAAAKKYFDDDEFEEFSLDEF